MLKYDGNVIQFLGRMGDLLWLNVLTLVCSLGIVTAGPAFAALHYVLYQIGQGNESGINKSFFKALCENFRQASVLGLLCICLITFMVIDLQFIFQSGCSVVVSALLICIMVLAIMYITWIFPVQSHYIGKIGHTLRNAFFFMLSYPIQSFAMAVFYVVPLVAIVFPAVLPISLLLGFSLPAWLSMIIYRTSFRKIDTKEEKKNSN